MTRAGVALSGACQVTPLTTWLLKMLRTSKREVLAWLHTASSSPATALSEATELYKRGHNGDKLDLDASILSVDSA
jgi:hypothetical protein